MNKPSRSFPRPLSEFLGATLSDSLKTQGFASTEIIARWADIVGTEIAAHSEPMKITWPRANTTGDMDDGVPEPATLVLRVEGPAALEIQHLSAVILERVNRFFGWQAIGRIALRQAPLRRRQPAIPPPPPDPAVAARIAESLPEIVDDDLRQALESFRGLPQERNLPSAPPRPVIYLTEANRPQPRKDAERERGMAAFVGRLRPCHALDYKFVVLSHNTIRGAAGAAVLNAELMHSEGMLDS